MRRGRSKADARRWASLALNLAFLSFVSLLPFSTAMLGAYKLRQPVSLACYFGNLLALALALTAFWFYAGSSGMLMLGNVVIRRAIRATALLPERDQPPHPS
jgi:uncharacterized membrane protein